VILYINVQLMGREYTRFYSWFVIGCQRLRNC